jgi:hypothetical protein
MLTNAKREKLLQVVGIFLPRTSLYGATLFTLSIIKRCGYIEPCCNVDMAAKGGCVSRIGGSVSEGDTGTTGNRK